MFASKSALQSNKGGSQGDRFPLYVTNIPVDMDEVLFAWNLLLNNDQFSFYLVFSFIDHSIT